MKPRTTMKPLNILTVLALLFISRSAMPQGNLVFNGGFDTDPSGWTMTNCVYTSYLGNPPGSISLLANNTSTLGQQINSLTPGQLYVVSGDYSGKAFGIFDVALDNTALFETNTSPPNYEWYSFSFNYTATSTSVFLSVQTSASGNYYSIDNLSMIAIPEPSSLWLVGLGGIVSALFFRNRRKYFP